MGFFGGAVHPVGSGNFATIGGGRNNNAFGDFATVGGGSVNTASYAATVGGGYANSASNTFACVGGGYGNTASAGFATVGGGSNNTASGYAATVGGGFRGLASRYGQQAYSAGVFSAQGDAQSVEFILRNTTSGAATSVLLLDGSSTVLSIRNNTLLSGILTVSGLKSDGSQVALYQRSLAIKNIGNTTTLVSSSVIGTDYEDDSAWNLTVDHNNTNKSLQISCTGAAGDNIRWVGVLRGLEIGMG
jgi:hypothetical protein